MRASVRPAGVLAFCLGVVLPGLSLAAPMPGTSANSPGGPSTTADTIIARIGAVPIRENPFHEIRTLAVLTKPLESHGMLTWRAPDKLEKLTLAPRREDLVIHGTTVTMTRGTSQPHTLDAAQNPALQVLADTLRAPLSGDSALLHRYYHISASGNEGRAWTLTLVPATEKVRRLLKQVTIAGTNNAITRLDITQANGDRQTITILP